MPLLQSVPLAKAVELIRIGRSLTKARPPMTFTAKKGPGGKTAGSSRTGRRMRGFEAASGLLRDPIRKAGESRGFAVTRLLTHWPEVAGPDLAPLCRPVKIGYGSKDGLGATLTLLTSGAAAPLVQMQAERLRDKVNAIYGYAAISRIRVTQTAGSGFAEGQRPFTGMPGMPGGAQSGGSNIAPPSTQAMARARGVVGALTDGVDDDGLKAALDRLATNVLTKTKFNAPSGPKLTD